MRAKATALLTCLVLISVGCGGGGSSASSSSTTNGPLTGNWQLNLLQEFPTPQTQLSISGFLVESKSALSGSVQTPAVGSNFSCGGVAALSGTVSGQGVSLSVNEGGTVISLSGTISSDGQSMFGNYQGQGGTCFSPSTSGTWEGLLIPPLNGSFTGTISSTYMASLQGSQNPVPITVNGTITQSSNAGASNATLAGTITAEGYPCFQTVTVTGTISGQNVYLDLFGYNGIQIGTLGQPSSSAGVAGSPATVVSTANGISLVDSSPSGLFLGVSTPGPCPPVTVNGTTMTSDSAAVALTLQ